MANPVLANRILAIRLDLDRFEILGGLPEGGPAEGGLASGGLAQGGPGSPNHNTNTAGSENGHKFWLKNPCCRSTQGERLVSFASLSDDASCLARDGVLYRRPQD